MNLKISEMYRKPSKKGSTYHHPRRYRRCRRHRRRRSSLLYFLIDVRFALEECKHVIAYLSRSVRVTEVWPKKERGEGEGGAFSPTVTFLWGNC